MSDWPFNPNAVPEGLPPSRVFDLEDPTEHASSISPSGTVVLLVSGERDRLWAAQAAIALCGSWARLGKRVVLADLHLEDPILHHENGAGIEGIVDVLIYGASLSRIATAAPDGGYYLIPAGTYAPDTAEVYQHPRWKKLVAGFQDTQATLLLFAPAESPDLTALAAWASEAVMLGSAADTAVEERLRASGIGVLAALEPNAEQAAQFATAPETVSAATAETRGPSDRGGVAGARRFERRRAPFIALVVLVLIALIGVLAYVILGLRAAPANPTVSSAEATELAADVGSLSRREGVPLLYSVAVKAFPSLDAARLQLSIERRRLPSTLFFISPEQIRGIVYFRILAGVAADSASASRLRDDLIRIGAIESEDVVGTWSLVQATQLSYDLGEFAARSDAIAKSDSLLARSIPSYVVAVPYADGSRRWQLYGGAYRDAFSAEEMGRLLAAAGVPAELTLRAGSPAVAAE